MTGTKRRQLKIGRAASAEPMSGCDLQIAEDLLAKLVARAWAADHPELFGPQPESVTGDLPHGN